MKHAVRMGLYLRVTWGIIKDSCEAEGEELSAAAQFVRQIAAVPVEDAGG